MTVKLYFTIPHEARLQGEASRMNGSFHGNVFFLMHIYTKRIDLPFSDFCDYQEIGYRLTLERYDQPQIGKSTRPCGKGFVTPYTKIILTPPVHPHSPFQI
jgi:hypothetical protein